MKNYSSIILSALVVLGGMSACSDSEGERPGTKDGIATFKGHVQSLTRVTGDTWDSGDAIGVYMLDAGQTLADVSVKAGNRQYTTNGTGDFTPANLSSDAIKLPESGNVDFIAYYPYTANVTAAYTIPVEVTAQTAPQKFDVLYSNDATGITPAATSIALGFEHAMSKIAFNITDETGANALASLSVKLTGFPTKADFSLVDASFANPTAVADITMVSSVSGNTAAASAIIIPVGTGTYKAEVTTAAGVLEHEFKATDDFESGKQYNYNVKITAEGQLVVSASNITGWTQDNSRDDIILDAGNGGTTPPDPGTGDYYAAGVFADFDFQLGSAAISNLGVILPLTQAGASSLISNASLTVVGFPEEAANWTGSSSSLWRGGWDTDPTVCYWLTTYPLAKEIAAGKKIQVTYKAWGTATAPKEFALELSTDNNNWVNIDNYELTATASTPYDFTYTVPADITSSAMYIRIRPTSAISIGGAALNANGNVRLSQMKVELAD